MAVISCSWEALYSVIRAFNASKKLPFMLRFLEIVRLFILVSTDERHVQRYEVGLWQGFAASMIRKLSEFHVQATNEGISIDKEIRCVRSFGL